MYHRRPRTLARFCKGVLPHLLRGADGRRAVGFVADIVETGIIDSPLRDGPARHIPALVSGNLKPFPSLSSPTPAIRLQIGTEGPHTATLATRPTTLGQARQLLQASIRAAHGSKTFSEARVVTGSGRLIVLPGSLGQSPSLKLTPPEAS